MRRVTSAAVVALLVLTGCSSAGDDGDGPSGTGETSSPAATTSEEPTSEEPTSEDPTEEPSTEEPSSEEPTGTGDATSTGGTDDIPTDPDPDEFPFADEPVEEEAGAGAAGQEVVDIRTGLHDGYDRVVLDLTGDEPELGWYVSFVDEAVEDPSGLPMDVDGDAFLQVAVRGIDWTTESPDRFTGGPVEGAGTEVVTEVVLGGLFEGQQQIVVGLDEETAFRVFPLSDPARIVIDVQHP